MQSLKVLATFFIRSVVYLSSQKVNCLGCRVRNAEFDFKISVLVVCEAPGFIVCFQIQLVALYGEVRGAPGGRVQVECTC